MQKKILYFQYVWPEPKSSAAGVRCYDLMECLLNDGWKITAISSSQLSEHSKAIESLGVKTISIPMNDSSFDEEIKNIEPSLIIYDRFVMEEQFGWKMREFFPNIAQLIDTQDLHSIRRARERMLKKNCSLEQILDPPLEEGGEDLLRELAAFYRVDGVLLLSEWEFNFMKDKIKFPTERLLYSPLFSRAESVYPPFSERAHFCFLGNYRHAPNLDGIEWFLNKIWPTLHKKYPALELHLYGAYPPATISSRHKKMGVQALGPIEDHREMLKKYRALIAPLRYGAGIKGKVLEAWCTGTPVLGTKIAFEGMGTDCETFNDETSFISLYEKIFHQEESWNIEQNKNLHHAKDFFNAEKRSQEFLEFIFKIQNKALKIRSSDLIGQMLRHQSNNATKYMSRWIEAKNKK